MSKRGFDPRVVQNEDDLKSLLDNEAVHAYQGVGAFRFPGTYQSTGKESGEMQDLSIELISFDYQFSQILKGKRKVSNRLIENSLHGFVGLYKNLCKSAEESTIDGRFAKMIIKSLRCKKYLKKTNRKWHLFELKKSKEESMHT